MLISILVGEDFQAGLFIIPIKNVNYRSLCLLQGGMSISEKKL